MFLANVGMQVPCQCTLSDGPKSTQSQYTFKDTPKSVHSRQNGKGCIRMGIHHKTEKKYGDQVMPCGKQEQEQQGEFSLIF